MNKKVHCPAHDTSGDSAHSPEHGECAWSADRFASFLVDRKQNTLSPLPEVTPPRFFREQRFLFNHIYSSVCLPCCNSVPSWRWRALLQKGCLVPSTQEAISGLTHPFSPGHIAGKNCTCKHDIFLAVYF